MSPRHLNPLRRWAPALRVARREAVRAKGRSILVLGMIALPVLGVTAADVVIQTADVSGAEAIERRLGTADARISVQPGMARVSQGAGADDGSWASSGGGRGHTPATLADLEAVLGRDLAAVEVVEASQLVVTEVGVADIAVIETDLTDDLTDGLYRITEGRVADAPDEVVVNGALAARGFDIGDEFQVRSGPTLHVVGIGENTSVRGYPLAVAPLGSFELRTNPGSHRWLVDAGGAVTWDEVRALNEVGALVLSRAVLLDPPATSELDPDIAYGSETDDALIAVIALVVAMALLEVVLLAGPAFAVIARRMQRSLALMAATGATPPQARRVVLASGIVLGAGGALLGVGLGLLVAWLSLPIVQRFSDAYLGPYDVPWLHLVGIAGFGVLSALLAAIVPAWISSRQDVVSVLAGRRGDSKPSLRSPLLGVLLLGGGVALAAYGATTRQNGEYAIAVAAIVAVLGMTLLVPVVVVALSKLAGVLPLPMRYAVRDAARHRTRTVPAVAAVAATVAGVVALGIANASDAAESAATYTRELPMGQASLTSYQGRTDWDAYQRVAEQFVPEAQVTQVQGVQGNGRAWTDVVFRLDGERPLLSSYGSRLGTDVPVAGADGMLPGFVTGIDDDDRERAETALRAGGVVVFVSEDVTAEEATVVVRDHGRGSSGDPVRVTVPVAVITVDPLDSAFRGVLSVEAAAAGGVEAATMALVIDGAEISEAQEQDVSEALAAISPTLTFYVERGYQAPDENLIILLVLGALGGLLMLGGTLTATFLSLSDARPDLATLAAVGASPRTRRAVAASYALVIGVVGAVLGAAVGFIPGIAVTFPLTSTSYFGELDTSLPSHFIDIPWLLIGTLVIALPVLTAAVVGAATRSRLPLVARID